MKDRWHEYLHLLVLPGLNVAALGGLVVPTLTTRLPDLHGEAGGHTVPGNVEENKTDATAGPGPTVGR